MKKIMFLCVLLLLVSCKPKDPSEFDLKSPCATKKNIYTNGLEPCMKRTPLGNTLA
jgi:hypothetical protein